MSETLHTPWIAEYLINIAETHGASLGGVPFHDKGKKVQIVEFLTFQTHPEDDCIWAKVSDKFQSIPARFTSEALREYKLVHQQDSQGKRLTEQRRAIVSIKSFKPIFQRVPVGNNERRMTKHEYLALLVNHVHIIGSAQEPVFGTPIELHENRDLEQWMVGLRQGGGGGNILKQKKEADKVSRRAEPNSALSVATSSRLPKDVPAKRNPSMKKNLEDMIPLLKNPPAQTQGARSLVAEHRNSWLPLQKGVRFLPPRDLPQFSFTASSPSVPEKPPERKVRRKRGPLDLSSSPGPSQTHQDSKSDSEEPATKTEPIPSTPSPQARGTALPEWQGPTTPSEWPSSPLIDSPAVASSPRSHAEGTRHSPIASPMIHSSRNNSPVASFSFKAPTPAQRRRRFTTSSSCPPPSSAPDPTTLNPRKTVSLPDLSWRHPEKPRRVPLPLAPPLNPRGTILVPNSDTSGTASQPTQKRSGDKGNTDEDERFQHAMKSLHPTGIFGPPAKPKGASVPELPGNSPPRRGTGSRPPQVDETSTVAVKGSQDDDVDQDGAHGPKSLLNRSLSSPSSLPVATYESRLPPSSPDPASQQMLESQHRRSPSMVEGTPGEGESLHAIQYPVDTELRRRVGAQKRRASTSPSTLLSGREHSHAKKRRPIEDSRTDEPAGDRNSGDPPAEEKSRPKSKNRQHVAPAASISPPQATPQNGNIHPEENDAAMSDIDTEREVFSMTLSQYPEVEPIVQPPGKLKGFTVDLMVQPLGADEPHVIGWEDLRLILLQTRRLRREGG